MQKRQRIQMLIEQLQSIDAPFHARINLSDCTGAWMGELATFPGAEKHAAVYGSGPDDLSAYVIEWVDLKIGPHEVVDQAPSRPATEAERQKLNRGREHTLSTRVVG